MVLKTFNIHEDVYAMFSNFCKEHGISMSKQVEMFMRSMVSKEPEVRREYLEKLERVRKGGYLKFNSTDELRRATS